MLIDHFSLKVGGFTSLKFFNSYKANGKSEYPVF